MNNEYDIDTRLLGKEDINFDTDGTGAQDAYTDLNGVSHPVTKLNASHLPIRADTRSVVDGATNVDEAVSALSNKIQEIEDQQATAMSEDKTVDFDQYGDQTARQGAIDAQLKNLGGHTLTFQFPGSLDTMYISAKPLLFEEFYNGTLVLDLNGVNIQDSGAFSPEGVLRIENCHCAVRVINSSTGSTGGAIQYADNHYGVGLYQVPNCSFESIAFIGTSATNHYAVYSYASNFCFSECSFTNSKKFDLKSAYKDYVDSVHNVDATAHADAISAGAATVVAAHNTAESPHQGKFELAGAISTHNSDSTAHSGTFEPAGAVSTHNSDPNAHSLSSQYPYTDFSNVTDVQDLQNILGKLGLATMGYTAYSGQSPFNPQFNSGGYLFIPAQVGSDGSWVPLVLEWGYTDVFSTVSQGGGDESGQNAIQQKTIFLPVPIRDCLHLSFSQDGVEGTTSGHVDDHDAQVAVTINLVNFQSDAGDNTADSFVCRARRVVSGYYNTTYRFHWFLVGVYAGSFSSLPIQYPPQS